MLEALLGVRGSKPGVGNPSQLPKPTFTNNWGYGMTMCIGPGGEDIYVVGGTNTASVMNKTLAKYNIATATWTKLADMPMDETRYGSMGLIGNTLVVIVRKVIAIYDIATGVWSTRTNTQTNTAFSTYGAAGGVYGGKLHFFGLPDVGTAINVLNTYDPVTNLFATLSTVNPKVYNTYIGGVLVGDRFYVAGSGTNAAKLMWFDYILGTWGSATLPFSYAVNKVVENAGKIYLLGCPTTPVNQKGVLEYNPATGAMTTLPELPNALPVNGAAVAVKGLVYCLSSGAPSDFYSYQLPTT